MLPNRTFSKTNRLVYLRGGREMEASEKWRCFFMRTNCAYFAGYTHPPVLPYLHISSTHPTINRDMRRFIKRREHRHLTKLRRRGEFGFNKSVKETPFFLPVASCVTDVLDTSLKPREMICQFSVLGTTKGVLVVGAKR